MPGIQFQLTVSLSDSRTFIIYDNIGYNFLIYPYYVLCFDASTFWVHPTVSGRIDTSLSPISSHLSRGQGSRVLCRWLLTHPGTHSVTWRGKKLAHHYVSLKPLPLFLALISNISLFCESSTNESNSVVSSHSRHHTTYLFSAKAQCTS